MTAKHSFIRYCVVVLLFAFVSACATPKVELNLSSTAGLNMDTTLHPLPVVVRIYQLTDAKAFEKATFNELWKNEQAVLGNTLLHKDSLTLDPDSDREIRFDRHDQARFVAIMAAFNSQTDNTWRVVEEVKGSFLGIKRSSRINIVLKEKTIEITEK